MVKVAVKKIKHGFIFKGKVKPAWQNFKNYILKIVSGRFYSSFKNVAVFDFFNAA